MPKKLSLKLDLKGKQVEENFAIGDPKPGNSPLKFQLEVKESNKIQLQLQLEVDERINFVKISSTSLNYLILNLSVTFMTKLKL